MVSQIMVQKSAYQVNFFLYFVNWRQFRNQKYIYFRKVQNQAHSTVLWMFLYNKMKKKHAHQHVDEKVKASSRIKEKNSIVEHIVSLSGQQTKKIYLKHGLLGKGGFSNCYITQKKGSEKLMATKVIEKANLRSSRTKMRLSNQIRIHKGLQHPNVVQFYHYFQDPENVYIMLELCENQSLNELMKERVTLSWPEAQSFLYGICNGVKYLHQKKYIHRDIKLGNIFLNEKYQVKIGDFGLSSQLEFLKENKRTVCGTPNYIAPEVLEGTGYYFQVDIWAIGIILYTFLYGFPPFESQNTPEIYLRIRRCDYKFPKNPEVPVEAIQLIKSILTPNPMKRATIDEILCSSFMKKGRGPLLELPASTYMQPPTKKQLQSLPVANLNQLSLTSSPSYKNFKSQKSTIDKTLSGEKPFANVEKCIEDISSHFEQQSVYVKQKYEKQKIWEALPEVFLVEIDLVAENAYYFLTSQNIVGIYEKDRQICFRPYSWFEDKQMGITVIPLFNNLFGEKSIVPFHSYKYKNLMNLKVKQIDKKVKSQTSKKQHERVTLLTETDDDNEKSPIKYHNLTKVNKMKDVILARMSNKSIQVIFQNTKDGFVYEAKNNRLFYFDEDLILRQKHSALKQVKIDNLMDTVKNFVENTKNSAKTPNIMTNIVLQNETPIRLEMGKLKYIYGMLGELKNKQTRHGQMRCSQ